MNPDLYPDVAAAGSLAAALESAAAELAVDITLVPGVWRGASSANIAAPAGTAPPGPARRPLQVHLAVKERRFLVSGRSLGVEMITGGTADLRDVVRAAMAWGSGRNLRELRERFPFLASSELAEAHERGAAAVVGLQWGWLRERALREPEFTGFGLLVEAAGAEPKLRQLYPVVSHRVLVFLPRTGVPCGAVVIAIAPADDGFPYQVQRFPHGGLIAEAGTAEEAVALAVAHLPADLGPAVLGSDEDG
ncbi:DUF6193 family natural product biosynthesis protein [Kitasatospora sp. NPDC127059]|uniref:DUF6193 family natural product biosynthesis protein n=1 Tax=unclassified Kitasatospora TaxID=2633591 RepID=UPI00365A088A